jgi:sortase A
LELGAPETALKALVINPKMRTLLIASLMVGGAIFVGVGLWIPAKAALAQFLLKHAWQETRQNHDRSKTANSNPVKPWPWADTHPIAKLSLQGEDFFVLADGGGHSLAFGPSHVAGSAEPGQSGNSVISAHRDTHFRSLAIIVKGDDVRLQTKTGKVQHYVVSETKVLPSPYLTLPVEDGVDRLVLVTCWPFNALSPNTQKRFAVMLERQPEP